MAPKINNPPPSPMWPWGSQSQVNNKLVSRTQLVDKTDRKKKKKGDPKNPALPSAALLDFIGPAHSADELRLPEPPMPEGHDADLENYTDRQFLAEARELAEPESRAALTRNLARINAPPDRMERLKALLSREASMLTLIGKVSEDVDEIQRKIREEQKEGKY
ncbi:MAG: hypothetical protein ACJ790_10920 [Myxococcaceae bacterium]